MNTHISYDVADIIFDVLTILIRDAQETTKGVLLLNFSHELVEKINNHIASTSGLTPMTRIIDTEYVHSLINDLESTVAEAADTDDAADAGNVPEDILAAAAFTARTAFQNVCDKILEIICNNNYTQTVVMLQE